MPARGQRAGLRLAVADDGCNDEAGVIESGAVSVTESIPQFAAFMNRAGRLRRHVTGNATWKGELFEQFFHTCLILGDVWVGLAIGALEPGISHNARPAVAGTDNI